MSKRILLIGPGHLSSPVWGYRAFPTNLHILYSALKNETDADVEVIDLNLEIPPPMPGETDHFVKTARDLLSSKAFDIAGISCWSSLNYTASLLVGKILRELNPNAIIAVGGYHVCARPREFLEPREVFDYIVTGDGEQFLIDLAGRKDHKRPGRPEIVEGTQGTLEVEQVWDGFPYTNSLDIAGVYLSRGCPYSCSFCMESVKGERSWRSTNPKWAANALAKASSAGSHRFIQVCDPLFGHSAKWRKEFLGEFKKLKSNLRDDVAYWVQVRADTVSEDDLEIMKEMNFELAIGLEAASGKILKAMNKTPNPTPYLERFKSMSDSLDKHEIPHMAFMVFNHPGETPGTLDEAFSFLKEYLGSKKGTYLTVAGQKFAFFPGSLIDTERERFERDYGARILKPRWWAEEGRDHHVLATATVPSMELVKAGQMERWRDEMEELLKINLEHSSDKNAAAVKSFIDQFHILNFR